MNQQPHPGPQRYEAHFKFYDGIYVIMLVELASSHEEEDLTDACNKIAERLGAEFLQAEPIYKPNLHLRN